MATTKQLDNKISNIVSKCFRDFNAKSQVAEGVAPEHIPQFSIVTSRMELDAAIKKETRNYGFYTLTVVLNQFGVDSEVFTHTLLFKSKRDYEDINNYIPEIYTKLLSFLLDGAFFFILNLNYENYLKSKENGEEENTVQSPDEQIDMGGGITGAGDNQEVGGGSSDGTV